jgi:3-oxoacid CoA-transferase
VFSVDAEKGLTLLEVSPFSSVDEIRQTTGCPFDISPAVKGA